MVADSLPLARKQHPLTGKAKPRIAPPTPLRHELPELRAEAAKLDIEFMPGQETALRYVSAKGADGLHLYTEVAVVAARQNGKTTLVKPVITRALRDGLKVMHIAHTRELPRQMFRLIADALSDEPDLFPTRRGKTIWPRYGSGQEEIVLRNGAEYRIAAASTGGARGWKNDLVIIDETREFEELDTEQAVMSTIKMSPDPQVIYLSNAGSEDSVWLNNIRARREEDPSLAYLEWSAGPERDPGDPRGWAEANWAMGHYPQVRRELEKAHRRALLSDSMNQFETENLCRWVVSLEEPVVKPEAWAKRHGELAPADRVHVAISVDPSGARASAVAAWQMGEKLAVRVLADVTGDPIEMSALGPELRRKVTEAGGLVTGYDPWTDADLARYFPRSRIINGREYAQASSTFANAVDSGHLMWDGSNEIGEDLRWTTRKDVASGAWMAVKAKDGRPITAALAAIRATWMASSPAPAGEARIY